MSGDNESPNKQIDSAIKKLMKDIEEKPPEVAVKILAAAISWEKVKAKISESDADFNPDNL